MIGGVGTVAALLLFAAPSQEVELARAVARSAAILVDLQEDLDDPESQAPGEWPYEGVYRERGEIPPGYRVGGTAIAATALLEAPGWDEDEARRAAVSRGLEFVLAGLGGERMDAGFSGTYDVRGWGHAYALEFLLRLRALERVPEGRAEVVDDRVRWLVATLEETEITEHGGWNYARRRGSAAASPFMTAPTIFALREAARQGEEVDAGVLARALDALEGARQDDGSIPYHVAGGGSFMDAKPGSMGRMAVTELALLAAGRSDTARLEDAVRTFFEHLDALEVRRRAEGTHVRPYGVAPYYVAYAYRYVALAIAHLPEPERAKYRALFLEQLLAVREPGGGWNDRVFPRSENFGTAMGLLALLQPPRANSPPVEDR